MLTGSRGPRSQALSSGLLGEVLVEVSATDLDSPGDEVTGRGPSSMVW